ncbi:MAG TPA: hypothetical protein VMW75_08180, partial [Thermoanaerobaculia bacterium]|nr:hypothetical protein [Thermoanaerobaculia bacterium]
MAVCPRLALILWAGSFAVCSLAAPAPAGAAPAATSPASPAAGGLPAGTLPLAAARERPGDGPPDLTPYQRPRVAEEVRRAATQ